MNDISKRRIRVEGKPDEVNGYMLNVYDAATGEQIPRVAGIDIHLEATALNTATVIYYEVDEHGKFFTEHGEPAIRTVTTANPEVAVTALEKDVQAENVRLLIDTALQDARIGLSGKRLDAIGKELFEHIYRELKGLW